MEGIQFDHLVRSSTRSRRSLLGRALAVAAGLLTTRGVDARKKRRRKKRKSTATPNELGCLEVGDPCSSDGQCCSGICDGKKGKRRCKAHDTGGCAAGSAPVGCGGTDVACTTSLGDPGTCATTTGNAGYCQYAPANYPCQTDVDCQVAEGGLLGPRAACIRCADGVGGSLCATVNRSPA